MILYTYTASIFRRRFASEKKFASSLFPSISTEPSVSFSFSQSFFLSCAFVKVEYHFFSLDNSVCERRDDQSFLRLWHFQFLVLLFAFSNESTVVFHSAFWVSFDSGRFYSSFSPTLFHAHHHSNAPIHARTIPH